MATKVSRKFEVLPSDRMQLVEEANCLVGHIMNKQTAPFAYSVGVEIELSKVEQDAYNAALIFLARQFTTGFKEHELVEVEREEDKENISE